MRDSCEMVFVSFCWHRKICFHIKNRGRHKEEGYDPKNPRTYRILYELPVN